MFLHQIVPIHLRLQKRHVRSSACVELSALQSSPFRSHSRGSSKVRRTLKLGGELHTCAIVNAESVYWTNVPGACQNPEAKEASREREIWFCLWAHIHYFQLRALEVGPLFIYTFANGEVVQQNSRPIIHNIISISERTHTHVASNIFNDPPDLKWFCEIKLINCCTNFAILLKFNGSAKSKNLSISCLIQKKQAFFFTVLYCIAGPWKHSEEIYIKNNLWFYNYFIAPILSK